MEIIKTIAEIRQRLSNCSNIGLVPTMGDLHEGHLSLVREACSENDTVVVSVFVNPTQFGPEEDYEEYPRDLKKDQVAVKDLGVNYIFHPEVKEMYPEGYNTYVKVEELSSNLCGRSRPGFFRGVTTVVSKLFNIVQPDRAYFGQKDYQQFIIIQQMIRDLNFTVDLKMMPIVREEDGLALSSRNKYLNREERKVATILYRALTKGKELALEGERDTGLIKKRLVNMIEREELARIDYIEIVDPDNLQPIDLIKDKVLLAGAIFIGETRLIDNIYLEL